MSEQPPPQQFQVEVPDDVCAGTYADFASLWHTPDAFVLDFAAIKQPPMQATDDGGQELMVVPTRIVSRVKIPPSQVFELMKALENQLSAWELETGQKPGNQAPPQA